MSIPIGLQMYSLKEEAEKDFSGTLEKVAAIGYDGVELAGYGGMTAAELKALLNSLGLRVAGSHVAVELLRDCLQQQIEFNLEIGNRNIVCPWYVAKTAQEYAELCALLNNTAETLKKSGMTLFYHNHGHEFDLVDGVHGLDYIWKNTQEEFVKSELDLYWVRYAGLDPLDYLKKLGNRAAMLHLKDMDHEDSGKTTIFGKGCINYKDLLKHVLVKQESDVQWLIIEQEHYKQPYFESVKAGYKNLKQMINGVQL